MKSEYQGIIKHQEEVVTTFEVNDALLGIAKIIRLIADEYPHAKGKLIKHKTEDVIYECHPRSIC